MAVDLWSSVSSQALILSDSPALVICSNGGRRTNTFPPSSAGFSGRLTRQRFKSCDHSLFSTKFLTGLRPRYTYSMIPRSTDSSSSEGSSGNIGAPSDPTKVPFGYSRKDVLLIGLGVTAAGIGLKSGLEFVGVDSLQAGNVVQLVLVLGLTIGWIATYIFRVSNKDMTYAQQLRDYEKKVMEKRLEGLTEAELEALLEQVEEEKRRLASGEQVK